MTIDEAILTQNLRSLQYREHELLIVMTNAASSFEKETAKYKRQLEAVRREIADAEPALYWARMMALIHTPCWRYRVA